MSNFKMLINEIRNCKKETILSIALVACEALFEIIIPRIMALLVDEGIEIGNMSNVYKYGSIMIVVVLASLTCGVVSHIFVAKACAIFSKTTRSDMYKKIQKFSFANIDKFSTGGLVTRLTTDVTNVQNAFNMVVIGCFRSPCLFIFGIISVLTINASLSLVLVGAVPFLVLVFLIFIKKSMPYFRRTIKKYDDLNNTVKENVGGIRTVKSFVREEHQKKTFAKNVEELYQNSMIAERYLALAMPVVQFAMYACIVLISWFGAKLIINEFPGMTTGSLMSVISYVTQILSALIMFAMIIIMVVMSKPSVERIVEVMNEEPTIKNPSNAIKKIKDGSIDFDNVSFYYNKGQEVLEDINLHIKSGETIGIIGATGSSKTSLIQLISRIYDVNGGEVKVSGHNVKEYDLEALRDNVAVVLQKNVLFSGTIKDNLRWGNPKASDKEMIEACKKARAHDFIMSFPDGYDTYIEQGGVNVSGGQKQRLCIARALLKSPKILILDDSTSAVDMKTDAEIRDTFKNDLPNVTKLIVCQRINSIETADRILVLDNGKISGFDSHENLLKTNKIYQDVYNTQTQMKIKEGE